VVYGAQVLARPGDREMLKGLALWALGIPLPIILLLYLVHVV
jgi:hypothetical protein